jgi:hypothetical protein
MADNWEGVEGATEHRTVGSSRAWCYQDGEWCYQGDLYYCDCCMEAAGFEKTWTKRSPEEPTTPR